MNKKEAIIKYFEMFDEGPPILDMDDEDAIEAIEEALESGEPMSDDPYDIPPDGLL